LPVYRFNRADFSAKWDARHTQSSGEQEDFDKRRGHEGAESTEELLFDCA